jgi:hypothetical protein
MVDPKVTEVARAVLSGLSHAAGDQQARGMMHDQGA